MILANIIGLNLLWFASVLGAANGIIWPAIMVLILLVTFNYIYVGLTQTDGHIIAFSVLSGMVIDGILKSQGWVVYAYDQPEMGLLPPLWIMLLWVGFGATLRIGMQWLLKNPMLGGLAMMVGAPLSYVSAGKLGAASIPDLWQAMLFIGVCWFVYFSIVVQIINKKETSNAMV